jgi:DNA-binding transcriptional LysR family regulator
MLERLTLDQLRVMIAVADTGSFSAAARRLGRVQSAISQSAQSLEATLGVALFDRDGKTPVLTDAGRVLLVGARELVRGAETLKARAESIADDVEPEVTLAVDAAFPTPPLMASLKGLSALFPCVPVALFTEHLGGAEQRLRDQTARLAIYAPLPGGIRDLEAEFLASVPMVPVVAADHPLATVEGPIARDALLPHVQLVLTDRTQSSVGLGGGILSVRIWRFADMATRLQYLLGGFGWCNMPLHLVGTHIQAGRLRRLLIQEHGNGLSFALHAVYAPGRPPGRAGRWLIDDLRIRLTQCSASLVQTRHGADHGEMPSLPVSVTS